MRRLALLLLLATVAKAQSTHYDVKVTPDLDRHLLRAHETITFDRAAGIVEFQKQPNMKILQAELAGGEVSIQAEKITLRLQKNGRHVLRLQLEASPHRGIAWFADQPGLDTAFYCEAWMVCDTAPKERATLRLEIVLPETKALTAVGPGQFQRRWATNGNVHFLFEQNDPVQTYLFSFGAARLNRLEKGAFVVYAPDSDGHECAFQRTAKAYSFLREKAGTGLGDGKYSQAVMPNGIAQEAAALALLPKDFLGELEGQGDDRLMTHELAHQWWGVLVGIRSWSDFWLNEGMADFMQDAFLEQEKGRTAYDEEMAKAGRELRELQASGNDRPLHWDGWQDAHGALGRLPYVKGALFLDRLRAELGEAAFWRGLMLYTSRNAGQLVDSKDFENAMEESSGRDLKTLFTEAVFH